MVYKFNKINVLLKIYYLAVDSIAQNFVLTQVSTVRVKMEMFMIYGVGILLFYL